MSNQSNTRDLLEKRYGKSSKKWNDSNNSKHVNPYITSEEVLNNNENKEVKKVEPESLTKTYDVSLQDALFKYVDFEESYSNATVTGAPRNAFKDILKRFINNYVATVALIVILVIFFMSVIIPFVSPFASNKPAFPGDASWVKNVPPSYAPVTTEVLSMNNFEIVQKINTLLNGTVIKNQVNLGEEVLLTYNKYLVIQNLHLIGSNDNLPMLSTFNSILGTNNVGYDIWTRTWAATRDSILLAILVATTDAIIGITIGAILGFYAGTWIDTVFTRIIDVIINIPTLIWFLMLITIIPVINPFTLYLILISVGWVYMVNNTRLWVITVKDQEYILAAKSIGASKRRQIFVHALPMVIGKLATNYVRRIIIVILSLSSLTFLGFLPLDGDPNLGTLLQEARNQIDINIWTLLLPSLILLLFSLSSQFVANGLHDALDPQIGRGK